MTPTEALAAIEALGSLDMEQAEAIEEILDQVYGAAQEDGWSEGHAEGYDNGHSDGYSDGYSDGRSDCEAEV